MKRLINNVGVFKDYLSDVEMSFCLAIRFYVDLFRVNIREVHNALAKFNFVQQGHDIFEDEFNFKDKQHATISSAIESFWITSMVSKKYLK